MPPFARKSLYRPVPSAVGVSSVLGAVGVVLFVIAGSDWIAVVLCAYYGLVARGEHSILNMVIARYFGRRSYGAISGAMVESIRHKASRRFSSKPARSCALECARSRRKAAALDRIEAAC